MRCRPRLEALSHELNVRSSLVVTIGEFARTPTPQQLASPLLSSVVLFVFFLTAPRAPVGRMKTIHA